MRLETAIKALADAMRPDDEVTANARRRGLHDALPDAEHDDATDEAPEGSDRPMRTMGYFSERPAAKGTKPARAANTGDGPMVPRAVLLAKPEKKGGAA